jgi:uridylate kinase
MGVQYKRALVKMSGEALAGDSKMGIHPETAVYIAGQIKDLADTGIITAVVVGGGNIYRGSQAPKQINRVTGDYMGMLATVINGLGLQDVLEGLGVSTSLYTSIDMSAFARCYTRRDALADLEDGKVVIFAGGIGRPYFTTDTTAALSAVEMDCDVLLKATRVDGVYDSDPEKNPEAVKYPRVTYREVLAKSLKVMDATAASLCMENNIPIVVFNIFEPDAIIKVINGEPVGTLVTA